MIDFHTHTILSDGELLPSELVRRAIMKGYTAIGLSDHVDYSNIDFVIPRIVKVAKQLNALWDIKVIPSAEITHVPCEQMKWFVNKARKLGAKVVIVHGETVSEPVIKGTNHAAINAGADILAHPGFISFSDAMLAKKKGVFLEITTRRGHSKTNKHVINISRKSGAKLVLNTDSHSPENLISDKSAVTFLKKLGLKANEISSIFQNSEHLLRKIK